MCNLLKNWFPPIKIRKLVYNKATILQIGVKIDDQEHDRLWPG